jgi:ankyrin repeat protein
MDKALASLPQGLNETYQRMIANIPRDMKDNATRLLQFLVHSRKPLRLAEAKEVIATQIKQELQGFDKKRRLFCETDVLDYCPSLITVVHAMNELHLAHFSVKEYLLGENYFSIATANISITATYLIYLTDLSGSNQEIRRDFPIARHAAELWTEHAALAQASEDISRMIVRFLVNEVTFQRWARLYQADMGWADNPGHPLGSKLYYICLAGLVVPARDLIDREADINMQGGKYGNALQAAAYRGHQEVVQLLLDMGAGTNIQGGKYGNALQAASLAGHQEVMRLLLGKGANINAQGGRYGNALQAAAFRGHQEVVQQLLGKGADINAQGGEYGNALQAASLGGHPEVVQLLLDKGADTNVQGGEYGNALQAASLGGHQEIAQLLLHKEQVIMTVATHDPERGERRQPSRLTGG